MSKDAKEIVMSLLLLLLLLCVINPGNFWMPDMLAMTLSLLVLIVFSIFAVFVWRERALDEREQLHKLMVGHGAFLVGASTLTLGLLSQSTTHSVDPWLAIGLGSMVLTKLIGIVWTRNKK